MSANMFEFHIHVRIIVHFAIQCTKITFVYDAFTVRLGVVVLSPFRHVAFDRFFQKIRIRIDAQICDARSACIAYGLSGTLNFTTIVGCWSFDGPWSVSVGKPENRNWPSVVRHLSFRFGVNAQSILLTMDDLVPSKFRIQPLHPVAHFWSTNHRSRLQPVGETFLLRNSIFRMSEKK